MTETIVGTAETAGMTSGTQTTLNTPETKPYHLEAGLLVGSEWKVTADRHNVILWQKEGRKKPRWRAEAYVSTLSQALNALVNQKVRDTELVSLRAVEEQVERLRRDIMAALRHE